MQRKEYILKKKNITEIVIIDSTNESGFSKIQMNTDAYISLLESGARKLEVMPSIYTKNRKRIVYRKGLGIRVHSVSDFVSMYLSGKKLAKSMWRINYKFRKQKREQA